MTTESEMFADIRRSRMIVGSGMMTAIRMTTIAIGIAICDFMHHGLCNLSAIRQKLPIECACESCKRMQALQQLAYKAPLESLALHRYCDTKRRQETHFRRWECHVPDPVLFVQGAPSPQRAGQPFFPAYIPALRRSVSGS